MPLTPHSGPLGEKKAAHLLRRCTFNVTPQRIRDFALLTANEAVDYLFNFDETSLGPNGLPPNTSLLFPKGPLWHFDGAPMHPPEMGAAHVNSIGGRNYFASYYEQIGNLQFPAGEPNPFANGCYSNNWQTCNYLTATYLQTGVFSWRMYEAIHDTSIRWKLVFWINSLFTTAMERQHYHYPHWKLMYDFGLPV